MTVTLSFLRSKLEGFAVPKLPDRKCRKCGKPFSPRRSTHLWCSVSCSVSAARAGVPAPARRKQIPCTCLSCGKEFTVQKYRKDTVKYCSRSCLAKSHLGQFNRFNPIRWRRGKSEKRNYKFIKTPDGRRMREHRWLMEQHVGRKLLPTEHVHHINGDWRDNRLENLALLTNSEHQRIELLEVVARMKSR